MPSTHRNSRRTGPALYPGLSLVAVFSLCACAQWSPATAPLPEVPVPEAWTRARTSAATATTPLEVWWSHFDDPMIGRLVSLALTHNTSVQSAQAALLRARAQRDVAAAGLQPRVDGVVSGQHNDSGSTPAGNTFNARFDASWEPDVFGANRSALDASEADARASAANLADVQVSLAAEVAVNYIQLRGTQTRLSIARDNLASQLETQQITEWRVQAGLATSLDAEQARTATAQTRSQIPLFEASAQKSLHALAVLTGSPPGVLDASLADQGRVPQAADDLALSLPADTLRQRPDIRAAEEQVRAAVARVAQADALRYPSFQLSGSLGVRALTLGSLSASGAWVGSLLAGLSLPVFDGGTARAQVRSQQAALQQAHAAYRAAVLAALQDVEDALVALRSDRERLLHLRTAAEAAGNAALLARHRYASGLIDFQVVLETQRTLRTTQDGVAATSADLGADHVRLYKALGGGWTPAGS